MTGYLTHALDRLTHIADSLASTFANVANRLAGTLSDLADGLSRAFAKLTDSLASALADLADSLAGSFADLAGSLAGALANILHRALSAFADVLDRLAGLAESPAGAPTDVFDRPPQTPHEFWIAVDGGEDPVDDRRDAIEPDFEQGLCLDPFDVDSELAEMSVDPRVEFDQVQDLRFQRNPGVEVVELEMDRVDLDHGDVQEDIGIATRVLDVGEGICLVLALGDGSRLGDVLPEAVLVGFFRGTPAFALAGLGGLDIFARPPRRF